MLDSSRWRPPAPIAVGLDARLWQHTGIGRYIRNLLRCIDTVDVVAWVAPLELPAAQAAFPRVQWRACDAPPFSLAEQLFWARELRGQPLSLFHSPHLNVPLATPFPLIATLHDLIPLRFPGTIQSRAGSLYFQLAAHLAVRRAQRILTHSVASRDDLVRLLGANPAKIQVVPLAADPLFACPQDAARRAAMRARYGLAGPYILYTGQWKRYKNLETLIAAFDRLTPQWPALKLVLVGRPDPAAVHVAAAIAACGARDRIVLPGHLADENDLAALYQEASVFAFPSRCEGFGLPPLEAMAAGVPVLAADASALPEVLGDAAWLLPPDDISRWQEALAIVLTDDDLRARMITAGRVRAYQFSWEATAAATQVVYRGC